MDKLSAEDAVIFLNNVLKIDHEALLRLINYRVECNLGLAEHPTIQVGKYAPNSYNVGFLGLLNGLFGVHPETIYGHITMECEYIPKEPAWGEKFIVTKIKKFRLTDHQAILSQEPNT